MQPLFQTVFAFLNEIAVGFHAFFVWFFTFWAQLGQAIIGHVQGYFSFLQTGYPAATPRPLVQARSQTIGFYRIMANPQMKKFQKWFNERVMRKGGKAGNFPPQNKKGRPDNLWQH